MINEEIVAYIIFLLAINNILLLRLVFRARGIIKYYRWLERLEDEKNTRNKSTMESGRSEEN